MNEQVRCHYCEKPAVVYCDYQKRFKSPALSRAIKVCDRPICNDHRRKVGHTSSPRLFNMVQAFAELGVTRTMLEAKAGGVLQEKHASEFEPLYDQLRHGVPVDKLFPPKGAADLNAKLGAVK